MNYNDLYIFKYSYDIVDCAAVLAILVGAYPVIGKTVKEFSIYFLVSDWCIGFIVDFLNFKTPQYNYIQRSKTVTAQAV